MHRWTGPLAVTVLGLLGELALAPAATQDAARQIKSKDVHERLDAIRTLRATSDDDKAERLLVGALKDKDWEVIEAAAEALSAAGVDKAWKPLRALTLDHASQRIRRAAARTLAQRNLEEAAEVISKQVKGKTPVRPADCLATIAMSLAASNADATVLHEGLDKALRSKELEVVVAAAPGVVAFAGDDRATRLTKLLGQEIEAAAAALDAIRAYPAAADGAPLVAMLQKPVLNDVLARRVRAALTAAVAAKVVTHDDALAGLSQSSTAVRTRFVRLAGDLGRAPRTADGKVNERRQGAVDAKTILPFLTAAAADDSGDVRAAAIRGLQAVGRDDALDAIGPLFSDADPRVRDIALRALVAERSIAHDDTRSLVRGLLTDPDSRVREDACVALGDRAAVDAVPDLVHALSDSDWGVAVCAAVSLGKTKDRAGAFPALKELRTSSNPHLAAAALVGLGHLSLKEAVPFLLEAMESRIPREQRVALAFLDRLTAERIPPEVEEWTDWWDGKKDSYEFRDRAAEAEKAGTYGFSKTTVGVYEDLDVLVFTSSRGDHIEQLLSKLDVEHRLTQSGQVPDAGTQPLGIYVANCTGECTPNDLEELTWFVKTGGYLFASCWSLEFTLRRCYPGLVAVLPTSGQVLDNVVAAPCSDDSPFLDGVFLGESRPVYRLEGAYLIDVQDHERVEVLIDSPQAATRWGGGNLACWFPAGHGVMLDSANHFDLQGLERIDGLKKPEDRMAWAVDHMAVDWADLRDLTDRKVWNKAAKAAEEVEDLSAFRFITNFVRHKRRNDR